jgi:hypothetical protein
MRGERDEVFEILEEADEVLPRRSCSSSLSG